MPESTTAKKFKPREVLLGFGVIAVIVWAIVALAGGSEAKEPKSTFEAKVTNISVIDPATVQAEVMVKNTGQMAAIPSCKVNVSNAGSTYVGHEVFEGLDKKLQPGEQWYFRGNITVTNQGAAYITEGSASCYN